VKNVPAEGTDVVAAGLTPDGGREGGGAAGAECVTVGVMFRKALNPTWVQSVTISKRRRKGIGKKRIHFRHHLANFSKVTTSPEPAARKEIFNDATSDIVPHLFELLVHFRVVFIVLDELHDERAVCERKELGILTVRKGVK
jgi:hypothetical protein